MCIRDRVTATAKQMVMRFGMSEKLGPPVFGHDHTQPFLGREYSSEPDYSDDVAREIDDEIRRVVEEAHQSARNILEQHRDDLSHTSEILLRRETIEREEFIQLLEGKSELDVFGPDEPVLPSGSAPEVPEEEPARKPERGPTPLPRERQSAVPPANPGRGKGFGARSGLRAGSSTGSSGPGGSTVGSSTPNTSSSLFPSSSWMNCSRSIVSRRSRISDV